MKNQNEILALFEEWNKALLSKDANQVAALYSPDAVLLPTVSNKVRHNHGEIRDYFEHFIQKNPSGILLSTIFAYSKYGNKFRDIPFRTLT